MSPSLRICGRLCNCCSCWLLVSLLLVLLLLVYNCCMPPSNNSLYLSYKNQLGSKSGSDSLPEVSLVVLKLPRSGSTWLAESLNRLPSVFISKEILQQGDTILPLTSSSSTTSTSKDITYASSVLSHLASALNKPMGKFAKRNHFLPDGRLVEDFYLHKSLKLLTQLRFVGFSLNPEHLLKIADFSFLPSAGARADVEDEKDAVKSSSSSSSSSSGSSSISSSSSGGRRRKVYAVVYVRHNLIKTAVSSYFGDDLHKKCGVSNLRTSSSSNSKSFSYSGVDRDSNTLISARAGARVSESKDVAQDMASCSQGNILQPLSTVPWNVSEFIYHMNRWNNRYSSFANIIEQDPYLSRHKQVLVYYENLQADLVGSMQRLFRDFGSSEDELKSFPSALATDKGGNSGGYSFILQRGAWKKRSSEDLSTVFTHYGDIKAFLTSFKDCRCYLHMLTYGFKGGSNGSYIDSIGSAGQRRLASSDNKLRIGYGCRGVYIDLYKGCYRAAVHVVNEV